jgi:hypothetical protein
VKAWPDAHGAHGAHCTRTGCATHNRTSRHAGSGMPHCSTPRNGALTLRRVSSEGSMTQSDKRKMINPGRSDRPARACARMRARRHARVRVRTRACARERLRPDAFGDAAAAVPRQGHRRPSDGRPELCRTGQATACPGRHRQPLERLRRAGG